MSWLAASAAVALVGVARGQGAACDLAKCTCGGVDLSSLKVRPLLPPHPPTPDPQARPHRPRLCHSPGAMRPRSRYANARSRLCHTRALRGNSCHGRPSSTWG